RPMTGPKGVAIGRVIRKFDPAVRDAANRALGKAGEQYVVELERARLTHLGRPDLAASVSWIADEVGDGLGYDLQSFAQEGSPLVIEVKTTRGPIDTPFFVSENERHVAAERGAAFQIYRLFNFGTDPKVFKVSGPLEGTLSLEPTAYRARVR